MHLFISATPKKRASHAFIAISRDSSEINTKGNIIAVFVLKTTNNKILLQTPFFAMDIIIVIIMLVSVCLLQPVCSYYDCTCFEMRILDWRWRNQQYYFVPSVDTMRVAVIVLLVAIFLFLFISSLTQHGNKLHVAKHLISSCLHSKHISSWPATGQQLERYTSIQLQWPKLRHLEDGLSMITNL